MSEHETIAEETAQLEGDAEQLRGALREIVQRVRLKEDRAWVLADIARKALEKTLR